MPIDFEIFLCDNIEVGNVTGIIIVTQIQLETNDNKKTYGDNS
jgi:hypothetical protein